MSVKLFVYGTLRSGEYNYTRFRNCVKRTVEGCTVEGNLYHVSPNFYVYPVAKLGEDGIIVGELLECRDGQALQSIFRMEECAGYELQSVSVTLPDGSVVVAKSFHYTKTPAGPLIPGGDWLSPEAHEVLDAVCDR